MATHGLAAPVLVLDPAGAGDSQWEDCAPGRTDLPRAMPEMPVLGITALDEDDPSLAGWHFARTSRPGQGRLTAAATMGLCVVLISPRHNSPEAAQALRDWGDLVHISQIAAAGVAGYTMITPYEITPEEERRRAGRPRFLHLYEMDNREPEACFQAMTPLVRQRLDDAAFQSWAWHPELQIDYVSTYRRRP